MVILWLLVFACIVVLFIKTNEIKGFQERLRYLEKRVKFLNDNLTEGIIYSKERFDKKTEPVTEPPVQAEEIPVEIKEEEVHEEAIEAPPAEELPPPLPPKQAAYQAFDFKYARTEPEQGSQQETRQTTIDENELVKRWQQFRANVDWEQFTGAKLFAWIGGIALFIGAGFFVKYSIDRNLIPPIVRLVIGAITGLILIIVSGRFERGRYDIMRHTLAAGGIGVLYSVIFAATLYYHYISNYAGFGLLIVVSAAAFVLAIYHKGIAVSVLGAIGAYATPTLVSVGGDNLYLLFLYLAIVNIGLYQVMKRLKSPLLMLVATSGTIVSLAIGSLFARPEPAGITIAIVWILNTALFSLFIELLKPDDTDSKWLLWSGIVLYIALLVIAFITMIKYSGSAPMLIYTAAMCGAIILARNNRRWYSCVIPYSVLTFIAAILWSLFRFDAHGIGWSFLLYLIYGIAGGIGPLLLIMKYGPDKKFLSWFKTFPVAVAGVSLLAILKDPDVSFWFWPMTLGLQVLGIFITILFGGFLQIGILALLFIISGVIWITNIPSYFIGYGFFSFTFIAGAILSLLIFILVKRLSEWRGMFKLTLDTTEPSINLKSPLMEWMTSTPIMGIFLLIAVSFINQRPLNPHPGMTTILCFLVLTLAIAKRLYSEPMGMVALLSSVFAQAIWIFNPMKSPELYLSALCWAGPFFVCSVIIPFFMFSSFEKWKRMWMVWALFELFQGIFVIVAADHLLDRALSGWVPLILAIIKLPAIMRLIKRLEAKEERNLILALHGGILLFYVSTIPVMLLDYGWIGLALVFEATALLWLNRRVEHPGLRWVSIFMAPAGLIILLSCINQMKGPESIIILNPAVLSVAACVGALSLAVRLSPYPEPMLKKINLPKYFLWLAAGTGFFLLNLLVADIFAGREMMQDGITLKFLPRGSMLQSIIYNIIWAGFGTALWRVLTVPKAMRYTGLGLIVLSTIWLIIAPFTGPLDLFKMGPFFNLGLIAYLPVIGLLIFLFFKEPATGKILSTKNLFLAMSLVAGMVFIKLELSTMLQPGYPLMLFRSSNLIMAVCHAFIWIAYGFCMLLWPKYLARPFRVAGLILIMFGILKSMILPVSFRMEFADMVPAINMTTLLYLLTIIMLIFLTVKKGNSNWPLTTLKPGPLWGVTLAIFAFCVMNIEIASAFGIKGRLFSLMTYGSLSHQLGYSLGWLIYSICMLIIGIKKDIVRLRWASLTLLVITVLKVFFKDLWSLGQLYRVASFIGLALVLILVSYLYQRYLSDRRKDA
ncbi:MAG: DUF2339 domain-containing protein [Deltaproteobacteria bacterium]|nr:DUF2339 domain-containing protein [Deltaproteobacteria bacterium]